MLTYEEQEYLKKLEYSLWKDETRFDTAYMERILHPEFFEFGRSGKTYARSDTIYVAREHIDARLEDMVVHELTELTVLITYKSYVKYNTTEIGNRSSLWIKISDDWKLYFHQGTPTT